MSEPDAVQQCPPHGPYRRLADRYECIECGEDVGWSPLFGRASKLHVPADADPCPSDAPEAHEEALPLENPDPKSDDVVEEPIVDVDLVRVEMLENLDTSDESIDDVCETNDAVVMRELIYKLKVERDDERATRRRPLWNRQQAVEEGDWLKSEHEVVESLVASLMSALTAVLDAPSARDRQRARSHARAVLATINALRGERGIWVGADDGTELVEYDRVAITRAIIDRFDCPWCLAKAGERCCPAKDTIPSVRGTHLGRLRGPEVDAFLERRKMARNQQPGR